MPIITSLHQNDFLRDRLNVIGSHCFTPKLDTKIHIRKNFFFSKWKIIFIDFLMLINPGTSFYTFFFTN